MYLTLVKIILLYASLQLIQTSNPPPLMRLTLIKIILLHVSLQLIQASKTPLMPILPLRTSQRTPPLNVTSETV